jgi:hypothetical protein
VQRQIGTTINKHGVEKTSRTSQRMHLEEMYSLTAYLSSRLCLKPYTAISKREKVFKAVSNQSIRVYLAVEYARNPILSKA